MDNSKFTVISHDKDNWINASADIDDVIKEMLIINPELTGVVTLYEASFVQSTLLNICIDSIIECMAECYSNSMPDEHMYDSFYDLLDHTAVDELKEFIDNWANKHDLNPDWLEPISKNMRIIFINIDEYKNNG